MIALQNRESCPINDPRRSHTPKMCRSDFTINMKLNQSSHDVVNVLRMSFDNTASGYWEKPLDSTKKLHYGHTGGKIACLTLGKYN